MSRGSCLTFRCPVIDNGGVKLRTRCANALLLGHDIVMMSNTLFFFLQSKE
jgi:hypothetical protein